jgi:hypothetical protein
MTTFDDRRDDFPPPDSDAQHDHLFARRLAQALRRPEKLDPGFDGRVVSRIREAAESDSPSRRRSAAPWSRFPVWKWVPDVRWRWQRRSWRRPSSGAWRSQEAVWTLAGRTQARTPLAQAPRLPQTPCTSYDSSWLTPPQGRYHWWEASICGRRTPIRSSSTLTEAYGPRPFGCHRACTSTLMWWMVSIGSRIRSLPRWPTRSVSRRRYCASMRTVMWDRRERARARLRHSAFKTFRGFALLALVGATATMPQRLPGQTLTTATLDIGGSHLRPDESSGASALTVSPALRFTSPSLLATTYGNYAQYASTWECSGHRIHLSVQFACSTSRSGAARCGKRHRAPVRHVHR